jgi:hypothetical protein
MSTPFREANKIHPTFIQVAVSLTRFANSSLDSLGNGLYSTSPDNLGRLIRWQMTGQI